MKLISLPLHYLQTLLSIILNVRSISIKNRLIKLRVNQNIFYIRNFMDLWMLSETYINQDYEKYGCRIGKNWTIVDIGAAFGDFSISAAKKSIKNRIIAVEPLPSSQDLLQKNLNINNIKNVEIYNGAISSQKNFLNIFEDSKNFGHSQICYKGACQVESITLEMLFSRYKIVHCDLIKCDCEGSEYDIFSKLGYHFYKKVDHIVMEYHLFDHKSKRKFTTLQKIFSENGFLVKITPNPVHSNLGFLFASRKD